MSPRYDPGAAQDDAEERQAWYKDHPEDDPARELLRRLTSGETELPASITREELAAALGRIAIPAFPGEPVAPPAPGTAPGTVKYPTSPSRTFCPPEAEQIAARLFRIAADLAAESKRWVTGAVYESVTTSTDLVTEYKARSLYTREPGGWFSWDCHEHIKDGSLDTTGWVRLVPESTGRHRDE